jgi:hypothetical protein
MRNAWSGIDKGLVYARMLRTRLLLIQEQSTLGGNAMENKKYKIQRTIYEDIDVDPDELMTVADAARELGVALSTMKSNVTAGRFTVIIDPDKTWQGRKLLLKKEVEEWKKDHPT